MKAPRAAQRRTGNELSPSENCRNETGSVNCAPETERAGDTILSACVASPTGRSRVPKTRFCGAMFMAQAAPALRDVSLDDKYALESGRVYLTGAQAFVRLLILQRQRDVLAGFNTAGFVSGYRGSPLGALDQSLWKAQKFLERAHITFQPGLNEDLAATALWGSQ